MGADRGRILCNLRMAHPLHNNNNNNNNNNTTTTLKDGREEEEEEEEEEEVANEEVFDDVEKHRMRPHTHTHTHTHTAKDGADHGRGRATLFCFWGGVRTSSFFFQSWPGRLRRPSAWPGNNRRRYDNDTPPAALWSTPTNAPKRKHVSIKDGGQVGNRERERERVKPSKTQ